MLASVSDPTIPTRQSHTLAAHDPRLERAPIESTVERPAALARRLDEDVRTIHREPSHGSAQHRAISYLKRLVHQIQVARDHHEKNGSASRQGNVCKLLGAEQDPSASHRKQQSLEVGVAGGIVN